MEHTLSVLQTYNVMVRFINYYYQRISSNGIAVMLSNMAFLKDGSTADPAIWQDWMQSVKKIEHEGELLTSMQAVNAMKIFLKCYHEFPYFSDDIGALLNYIREMQNNVNHIGWKHWEEFISQVLSEEDSRKYVVIVQQNTHNSIKLALPILPAYIAMLEFLNIYYKKIGLHKYDILLKNMVFLKESRRTTNPMVWHIWMEVVEKIESQENKLTPRQVFVAMKEFLEKYSEVSDDIDDIRLLVQPLIQMQENPLDIGWQYWIKCINDVKNKN